MEEVDFYRAIIDGIQDGVYFVDLDRRITFWNKGAERITGYRADEVVGSSCMDNILVHVDDQGRELCKGPCPLVEAVMKNLDYITASVYLHHKKGHRVPVNVSASPIRDRNGTPIGAVEIFYEKTGSEMDDTLMDELKRAALLDPLTHLPNRRYLEMNLTACLTEYRSLGRGFGLAFANVDDFKLINDTYGHAAGDGVLRMIASTMEKNTRSQDVVGRWGGEEFLLLIRHTAREDFFRVADRLRRLVESAFLVADGQRLAATITMGAAYVRLNDTAESLLMRADHLLYEGKGRGKNRVVSD